MSSTLNANTARAPEKNNRQDVGEHVYPPPKNLGGLLEGVGPSMAELSVLGLLRGVTTGR